MSEFNDTKCPRFVLTVRDITESHSCALHSFFFSEFLLLMYFYLPYFFNGTIYEVNASDLYVSCHPHTESLEVTLFVGLQVFRVNKKVL